MDAARASPWLWAPWVAWALGSIPVGYLLVRARLGLDVRTQGSGTVGARNVARLLGWPGFVATLGLDLLKGVAAVYDELFHVRIRDFPWCEGKGGT